MKITINKSDFNELLKESIKEVLIREGIVSEHFSRTVVCALDHESHVNFSLLSNPTYTEKVVNGITVYSLKKETGWRYMSMRIYNVLYKLIGDIIDKFLREHPGNYNTTIVLPSSTSFNKVLANIVKDKIKYTIVIDDLIVKLTVEEVYECITTPNSPFYQMYGKSRKTFMEALNDFNRFCKNMKDGYFRTHLIKDQKMKEVITQTMKINVPQVGTYLEAIDNKDIFLLDDTITHGNSMSEAVAIIKEYFKPKSITVITINI